MFYKRWSSSVALPLGPQWGDPENGKGGVAACMAWSGRNNPKRRPASSTGVLRRPPPGPAAIKKSSLEVTGKGFSFRPERDKERSSLDENEVINAVHKASSRQSVIRRPASATGVLSRSSRPFNPTPPPSQRKMYKDTQRNGVRNGIRNGVRNEVQSRMESPEEVTGWTYKFKEKNVYDLYDTDPFYSPSISRNDSVAGYVPSPDAIAQAIRKRNESPIQVGNETEFTVRTKGSRAARHSPNEEMVTDRRMIPQSKSRQIDTGSRYQHRYHNQQNGYRDQDNRYQNKENRYQNQENGYRNQQNSYQNQQRDKIQGPNDEKYQTLSHELDRAIQTIRDLTRYQKETLGLYQNAAQNAANANHSYNTNPAFTTTYDTDFNTKSKSFNSKTEAKNGYHGYRPQSTYERNDRDLGAAVKRPSSATNAEVSHYKGYQSQSQVVNGNQNGYQNGYQSGYQPQRMHGNHPSNQDGGNGYKIYQPQPPPKRDFVKENARPQIMPPREAWNNTGPNNNSKVHTIRGPNGLMTIRVDCGDKPVKNVTVRVMDDKKQPQVMVDQ